MLIYCLKRKYENNLGKTVRDYKIKYVFFLWMSKVIPVSKVTPVYGTHFI